MNNMNRPNMRRALKQPTLRMEEGGAVGVATSTPEMMASAAAAGKANVAGFNNQTANLQKMNGTPPVAAPSAPVAPDASQRQRQALVGPGIFGQPVNVSPITQSGPIGLREGGEIHADVGGMWANAKRAVTGQAPETPSEAMNRRLNRPTPAPATAQPAPAPAQPAPAPAAPMGSQAVLDNRMKAAGLRHGGDLETGHGGDVPGTGTGDKIPAKYEPGEFVVSNDMLDAEPSLRGHLQSLRKTVLAEKGMTPEQADAKALGYSADDEQTPLGTQGHRGSGRSAGDHAGPAGARRPQVSLRAADSFYDGGLTSAQRAEMAANVNTARNTALPPSPGTMTQGPAGVTPPGGHYPTGQALVPQGAAARVVDGRALATTSDVGRGHSAGPTNMARDPHTIYQGTSTSGKFDVATRPAAGPSNVIDVAARDVTKPAVSGPPKPPSGYRGGFEAGQKFTQGAAKVLRNVAGPLAAVSGGMELADGIDQGDKKKMLWGGLDTAAGIGLATGVGTVPAAAYLGARGVYEGGKAALAGLREFNNPRGDEIRAMMEGTGGTPALTPASAPPSAPAPTPAPTTPPAPADEFSNAAISLRNPAGQVRKTVQPNGTTSYSGSNVSGDVSMMGADGAPLAGRPGGGVSVMGKYSGPGLRDGAGGDESAALMAAAQRGDTDALHSYYASKGQSFMGVSADDFKAKQASLREAADAPKLGEYGYNRYNKVKLAKDQNAIQQDHNKVLREGQAQQLEIGKMSNQLSRFNALREHGNADRTYELARETHDQTIGDKRRDDIAKEFTVFTKNKAGENVPDQQASAESLGALRQIIPGLTSTDAKTREAALPDARAMHGIFAKARAQDPVGWEAMKFWQNKRPALSGMPDAEKSSVEEVSGLGGLLTLNAANGDTLLKQKDGRVLNLGVLDARQRKLLDDAQKRGWGK